MTRRDHAAAVRELLDDPWTICAALELTDGAQRTAAGVTIRCPSHTERTPSCSVTRGPDGTVRCKCFGCDWSSDGLGLVALVRGLDIKNQFAEVLATAAELLGRGELATEIRGGGAASGDSRQQAPQTERQPPPPPREYPPAKEVTAMWEGAIEVIDDAEASEYLVGRRIDPDAVTKHKLLRVLAPEQQLPEWAFSRGGNWSTTGHRLIARVWDAHGSPRSMRAWRVRDGSSPKRLPPSGHRASELVLANHAAAKMLKRGIREAVDRIIIAEGEPDHTVLAIKYPDVPVLGIGSGSWVPDFARKIPNGANVYICTDHDEAGDRYAATVAETLGERCCVWRAK